MIRIATNGHISCIINFSFMPDGTFDEYEKLMMQESASHKPGNLFHDD